MATANLESKEIWGTEEDPEFAAIAALNPAEIAQRTKMLQNNQRAMKSDMNNLEQQIRQWNADIKDNTDKVKLNKQLPYLVANVVEVSHRTCPDAVARPAVCARSAAAFSPACWDVQRVANTCAPCVAAFGPRKRRGK